MELCVQYARVRHCHGMQANEKPKFEAGDIVLTPTGERLVVVQCDLWGCTVDNGTPGGARFSCEKLTLIQKVALP